MVFSSHTEVQQTQPQSADYRGNVSLRECLMYLLLEVRANNWQSDNDIPVNHFYIDRTKFRSFFKPYGSRFLYATYILYAVRLQWIRGFSMTSYFLMLNIMK